jgi:hypothetical protein
MSIFSKLFVFIKKWKVDIFLLSLLLVLFSILWRQLTKSVMVGEMFCYFIPVYTSLLWKPIFFTGYETFGILFGSIFVSIFHYHWSAFFWIQFIDIAIINVIFYIMVKIFTKNRFIAFFSALIFSSQYFGHWDMYYQNEPYFLERAFINIPALLTSFLFLHLFLEKKLKKYFIISIVIYFLGQGLSHFGTLFTLPFVIYPIFFRFFNEKKKKILRALAIAFPYLLITVFFYSIQQITEADFRSTANGSFLHYILNPQIYRYPEQILRQLAYWSQYPLVLKGFGSRSIFTYRDINDFNIFTPVVALVYIILFVFIYKKLPKFRALSLTILLGTASSFFLNTYVGSYKVFDSYGSNRYLYHPTILLSIFWGLFLWILVKSRNKILIFITIFILGSYYVLNWMLISKAFQQRFENSDPIRKVYDYIVQKRNSLADNTLVVLPFDQVENFANVYFTTQLGRGTVVYVKDRNQIPPSETWQKLSISYKHVVKLKYSDDCSCVLEENLK